MRQIGGKKRWKIYAPVIELPHRSQLFTPQAYSGQAPVAEIELKAGDLLYLPRGFLHSTTTSDSFSAHVTVGITVYTWADLLKEFLQMAIRTENFRKALTPGFASNIDIKQLLRQQLADAMDQLRSGTDLDELIDSFTCRVRATHLPRPAPFQADIMVMDLESTLQMPPLDTYSITQEDEKSLLEFKGVRYQLPVPVASTLGAMAQLQSFRPSELPDHLSADGILALSRHLLDIGFLTLVKTTGS